MATWKPVGELPESLHDTYLLVSDGEEASVAEFDGYTWTIQANDGEWAD